MELYILLIALLLVFIIAVLLPVVSGIGSFKIDKTQKGNKDTLSQEKDDKQRSSLKFRLASSNDDSTAISSSATNVAGRFDVDSKTGLKKRVIGKYDQDPNNYDYDINELIEEDELEKKKELAARLDKYEGSKEKAYEELV